MVILVACVVLPLEAVATAADTALAPDGWQGMSPRDELRPEFLLALGSGPDPSAGLTIASDDREGLQGWWQKSVPVAGGSWYRFSARRRSSGVPLERRSVLRVSIGGTRKATWSASIGRSSIFLPAAGSHRPRLNIRWKSRRRATAGRALQGSIGRLARHGRRCSSCTCNGQRMPASSGATSRSCPAKLPRGGTRGWRRSISRRRPKRRGATASSSRRWWPRPPGKRPTWSCCRK